MYSGVSSASGGGLIFQTRIARHKNIRVMSIITSDEQITGGGSRIYESRST